MTSQKQPQCACTSSSCSTAAPTAAQRVEQRARATLERRGTRRDFIRHSVGVAAAASATGGCTEEFFRKHYKELTVEEKKDIFQRIEAEVKARYGVNVDVSDPLPLDGVQFVYGLDLTLCNGNRRCVEACARENNLPDRPQVRYIRVLEMDRGTVDLENSNPYYDHDLVPAPGKVYLPVQCQQCKHPPCVKVCPTGATWKDPDGIVVVDYNWCIGCRYCLAACPYYGRRFNLTEPSLDPERINPDMGYLSNRPRMVGVAEKCTFCLQRTRAGKYPACLEVCPTGARVFGNVLDPDSEINYILNNKRVYILKEDVGTVPRFYYFFDV
jgi:Fe-S-cluster-containing dehydrogenase component